MTRPITQRMAEVLERMADTRITRMHGIGSFQNEHCYFRDSGKPINLAVFRGLNDRGALTEVWRGNASTDYWLSDEGRELLAAYRVKEAQ